MSFIHSIVNDAKKGVKGAEHLGHEIGHDIHAAAHAAMSGKVGTPSIKNPAALTRGPYADNPGGLVGLVMRRGRRGR